MGKHPTSSLKNRRKKIKKRYSAAREEAQLAGIIPTTPDGAVRDERVKSVDPLADLPQLVRKGLSEGWRIPDNAKPTIVAHLLRPFYTEMTVMTKDGDLVQVEAPPKLLNELARTLLALDQADGTKTPEKNGNTVIVQNNIQVGDVFDDIERDIKAIEGVEVVAQADSNIQANGTPEPMDAT